MTRGKGESSVYKDGRGYWTAAVELPALDGKRRRRVIRNKDKGAVLAKLDETRAQLRADGDIPTANMTVEDWFRYWLRTIVAQEVRPKTAERYRQVTEKWVVKTIGTTRLSQVTPMILRRVTDAMLRAGQSSTTALTAHRIMSVSLEWAVREGRLPSNPAKRMAAPRKAVKTLDVLELDEAVALLERALKPKEKDAFNGALWATTLLTGARRGEVLGLQADRVTDVLDISWQLQRFTWEHGCGGTCLHRRGAECPDRTVTMPADYEYQHLDGGLFLTRPKSRAGWRLVPLVEPLKSILRKHLESNPPGQHGLVFTNNGRPIDPNDHSREWKAMLKVMGIDRNIRLHDVRHATVDLLSLAGVPDDMIMAIVGHSSRMMTHAYRRRNDVPRMRKALEDLSALMQAPRQENTTE